MTRRIAVHIHLRVDAGSLIGDLEAVERQLTQALGESLAGGARALASDGIHGTPRAAPHPKLIWAGAGVTLLTAAQRARGERHLRRALHDIPGVISRTITRQHALDIGNLYEVRSVDFRPRLGELLQLIEHTRLGRVDEVRALYAERLDEHVPATAWIVDVLWQIPWRRLADELLTRIATQYGADAPRAYFWDDDIAARLIALDRRRLTGKLPRLTPPASTSAYAALPAQQRVVFFAAALPELALEEVAELAPEQTHAVPLGLALNSLFTEAEVGRALGLSPSQWSEYFSAYVDAPIEVHVRPFRLRRRVLAHVLDAALARQAHRGGELVLLNEAAVARRLPIAAALRAASDAATLALGEEHRGAARWERGWHGAWVWLDFGDVAARRRALEHRGAVLAAAGELARVLALADGWWSRERSDALIAFVQRHVDGGEASRLELLLDELERRQLLDAFFDAVRQLRALFPIFAQRAVIALAVKTRHRRRESLRALIKQVEASERDAHQHDFDVARQRITLKSGETIDAAGERTDDKAGVVAEVAHGYYSATEVIYRPRPDLLKLICGPTQKRVGELMAEMLCEGEQSVDQNRLVARAMHDVMQKLPRPLRRDDFEPIELRSSVRIVALIAREVDGITRTFVRYQPVQQLHGGKWEAAGEIKEAPAAELEGVLKLYHVQHLTRALGIAVLAESLILLTVAIVLAPPAAAAEGTAVASSSALANAVQLTIAVAIGELVMVLSTDPAERTIENYLVTALLAELEFLGFKGLTGAARRGITLALGRAVQGKLVLAAAARLTTSRLVAVAASKLSIALTGGVLAVVDLFVRDLFRLSRCRGFSSPREYWSRLAWGFGIGLVVEVVAAPILAPLLRPVLGRAVNALEAARVLRRSGLGWQEIAAALRAGRANWRRLLEETLERPSVTGPLDEELERRVEAVIEALKNEEQPRLAPLAEVRRQSLELLFDSLKLRLHGGAARGFDRLLRAAKPDALDALVHAFVEQKAAAGGVADYFALFESLDQAAVEELVRGGRLATLARSARTLRLARLDARTAWTLLRVGFRWSLRELEGFLERLEALPPDVAASVLTGLRGERPPPPELLLAGARLLGTLDEEVTQWLSGADAGALDALERMGAPVAQRVRAARQLASFSGARRLLALAARQPSVAASLLANSDGNVVAVERYLDAITRLPPAAAVRAAVITQRVAANVDVTKSADILLDYARYRPLPLDPADTKPILDAVKRVREEVPGLFQSVDPNTPPPGWTFDVPPWLPRGKVVVAVTGPSGSTGEIERSFDLGQKRLIMSAAFLDELPSMMKEAPVAMVPGRGVPTIDYMNLFVMRRLGIPYQGLKSVGMSHIQNVETLIQLHWLQLEYPHESLDSLIRRTASFAYAESALTQAGLRITRVKLDLIDSWRQKIGGLMHYQGQRVPARIPKQEAWLKAYGFDRDEEMLLNFNIELEVAPR